MHAHRPRRGEPSDGQRPDRDARGPPGTLADVGEATLNNAERAPATAPSAPPRRPPWTRGRSIDRASRRVLLRRYQVGAGLSLVAIAVALCCAPGARPRRSARPPSGVAAWPT